MIVLDTTYIRSNFKAGMDVCGSWDWVEESYIEKAYYSLAHRPLGMRVILGTQVHTDNTCMYRQTHTDWLAGKGKDSHLQSQGVFLHAIQKWHSGRDSYVRDDVTVDFWLPQTIDFVLTQSHLSYLGMYSISQLGPCCISTARPCFLSTNWPNGLCSLKHICQMI